MSRKIKGGKRFPAAIEGKPKKKIAKKKSEPSETTDVGKKSTKK